MGNLTDDLKLQLIRPEDFYSQNNIEVKANCHVNAIDRKLKTVSTDSETIPYDKLILATGSIHHSPAIEGIDHPKVFNLRTTADARLIHKAAKTSSKVAIIGAGFIGLEVAASLSKQNKDVTVIELADRVLSRVTSPEISSYFKNLHESNGVNLILNESVKSIKDIDEKLILECTSSNLIEADFIVLGTGAAANSALAEAAGLDVANGVLVNQSNQTSDPDIYAMGDCCNQYHPIYKQNLRLESVQNAVDQAKVVAASLTNQLIPQPTIPWFWSDQFEVKLQIVGIANGYDDSVCRGVPELGQSFSIWYFKGNQLLAVDAINDPMSYVTATKLIKLGKCPDKSIIADSTIPTKELLSMVKEA